MGCWPVPCYAPLATFGVNVPTLFLILFYLHHDVTTRLAIGIHSYIHACSLFPFLSVPVSCFHFYLFLVARAEKNNITPLTHTQHEVQF